MVPTLLQDPDYVKTTVSLATVPFAAYRPRCYREYRTLALGGKIGGQAVIFMHKLRSQQGIERVVIALDIGDTCMDIRPQDCVEIAIVQRHPLFGKRSAVDGGFTFQSPYSIRNYSGGMANTPLVRFRPGQLSSRMALLTLALCKVQCPKRSALVFYAQPQPRTLGSAVPALGQTRPAAGALLSARKDGHAPL